MVVQHNMTAINANRYLGINNNKLSKSLEKLSSGYQINRAGDNAAGLAVSEKMRAQIGGIDQAIKNAEDGISMVQTFEGALTETHSILQRMKTLATQSANGTYDDEVDRAAIQLEYDQLADELNQIADTDFNGVQALNDKGTNAHEITPASTVSVSDAYTNAAAGPTLTYNSTITLQVGARSKDAVKFTFDYATYTAGGNGIGTLTANMDVSAKGLKVDTASISLTSQASANAAIDQIGYAINKTSLVRATFGAIQNRLEHKIDNMNVTSENLTAAESRIRDTDMAKEMMNFTKNQILSQASQSMLAQANQLPQGVLSLLQ